MKFKAVVKRISNDQDVIMTGVIEILAVVKGNWVEILQTQRYLFENGKVRLAVGFSHDLTADDIVIGHIFIEEIGDKAGVKFRVTQESDMQFSYFDLEDYDEDINLLLFKGTRVKVKRNYTLDSDFLADDPSFNLAEDMRISFIL